MNIKCEYCGGMFDDTLEKCPNCGAANVNVKRSTVDQPTTIEELKSWYSSKGLPPYETTRFFIGENYKNPRAFGIYKDENTGKFIVYKNKDTGERAVRYEGTDEAYAVNELFMRLKQEILEQKARNVSSGNVPQQNSTPSSEYVNYKRQQRYKSGRNESLIVGAILIIIVALIFCCGIRKATVKNVPIDPGYYRYKDAVFYHLDDHDWNWLKYDTATDSWVLTEDQYNTPLTKNYKKAQKYFLSSGYKSEYGCSDACESEAYYDFINNYCVDSGYYTYDDSVYYHDGNSPHYGWYIYDDNISDWEEVGDDDIPNDLKHEYLADDFWYTPDWDTETEVYDFTDSDYYRDNYAVDYDDEYDYSYSSSDSYSSDNDSWWSGSDDSWDWDSDDSWDWGGSDSWDSGGSDWGSDW